MTDDRQAGAASPTEERKVLRELDDDARKLARTLLRGARYMALAVLDHQTGFPAASRVLTGTDADGVPVILVSALSSHTKSLVADPRCSLLAGEPGKGDPLAHPRMTVLARAERVSRETPDHVRIRKRFLARHPKAALYADFLDFGFFRITPESALLNGGFGRAFSLPGADLMIREPGITAEWSEILDRLETMPDMAARIAEEMKASKGRKWNFCGADKAGFDLVSGEFQLRHEVETLFDSAQSLLDYISDFAKLD